MEDVGVFYGHLAYSTANWYILLMSIWSILWSFDIFNPILVCCTKKIWQPI
jgi:hypothetical protein